MIGKTFGWIGVAAAAAMGGTVAIWAQAPYPVSILDATVLTPVVKPGDDVRIEVLVDRRERCPSEVTRFRQDPDGDRDVFRRPIPASYGRLGRDAYVIRVQTDPDTPFGPGEIFSTSTAACNPWQQWIKPASSGDPRIYRFEYGPATVNRPPKYEREYNPKMNDSR